MQSYITTLISKVYRDDFQGIRWSLQGSGSSFDNLIVTRWYIDLANYDTDTSLHHAWKTQVIIHC
jgi:hypothetical protein